VTLTGTIRRDGKLTGLHVAAAKTDQPDRRDQFVRAILNNLKTWWLEPGPREDRIRITSTSGSDSWLPDAGPLDLKFELSNQITIRAASTK
jgi:hypothetical protein